MLTTVTRFCFCLTLVLATGACADSGLGGVFERTAERPRVTAPDPVEERLADAADQAAGALQTLAAIEQARTPTAPVPSVANAPAELRRLVTIDWVGPIAPIAERLAERAGYSFNTIGDAPTVPIVVTLRIQDRPLIDVLRDIGLQAGNRASLAVDANLRRVEVRYGPTPLR